MRVYTLDDAGLTEEQIAVVFAMTSRSPDTFDTIAGRVSTQRAQEFHERWVLDYGHASVAEHAVLHLAVEDISRLAADELENNRLASYTEKSSRYQVIAQGQYHIPEELQRHPGLRTRYTEVVGGLFNSYQSLLHKCTARLREQHPQEDGEQQGAYDLRIRRLATDACRGVLPAATLTNVGMTANARTMEHAVSKLLSAELWEMQRLGEELMVRGRETTPTLIKYAAHNPYIAKGNGTTQEIQYISDPPGNRQLAPEAELVDFDPYAPERLAEALLYRSGKLSFALARRAVAAGDAGNTSFLIRAALDGMGPHDTPPREFETIRYKFELRMDYGALREFRRHRMMTPIFQPLTAALGVQVPTTIWDTGLEEEFRAAAEPAGQLFDEISEAGLPSAAQYAVTHAHLQRVLLDVNLRELYHVLRLRTSARAHESIRIPMLKVLERLNLVHPVLVEPLTGEISGLRPE